MALHGEEAYERKLRPLYDALDARSYKQAVKLADVVLKKYKNDQLARALKGYALYHTGKHQEALQLMRDIVAEGPEAERVAYAAAAEKHPRDTDILAGLFKSYVREFNFVKQQQVAMKLSKLVASSPDNKCGWWIVCSLALQARAALLHQDQHGNPLAAGGGLAPDKLLQLAETMAARQAAAAVQHAPAQPQQAQPQVAVGLSYEALLLYLDILQGQGKAQQALEVVEGPLGGAVPLPADRLQLRAAALVRAGDLPAAAACYRQAVQAAPDDWLSWQLYLDCLLPGSSGGPSGSRFPVGVVGGLADIWDRRMQQQQQQQQPAGGGIGDDAAAALAAAKESMRQLSAEVAPSDSWRAQLDNGVLRAPHLWRCELLLRRQRLAGAADGHTDTVPASEEQQQELAAAVGEAFPMLAANFSCVSDLRAYLATLSGTAAEQLATAVHRQAAELNAQDAANSSAGVGGSTGNSSAAANGGGGGGVSGEVRRLQRLVNAHQIEQELGLPRFAAPDEAVAHARCLLDLYRRHMHLSAGLDEKERGYGEELVAGAVESLMAAAVLETAAAAPAQAAGPGAAPPPERALARMVQAVLVLEAAQQRRKVSAPLRLAATALYSLLGAPKLAAAQFAALDIKSILHDSMTGHWMLPLLPGGATAAAYLRW
ncbi:hypothetical protein CHLNCDRAFT_144070 [Chlorella variabilis]|uniref:Uncharacterized protein n=1 Tax=Chlorella variabilis TaxID=554065 RepID=E1ZBU0_CHLVA|nr:hypothetical protein CHLNCDRAFT_144070 [Chlorella variabilis]EFN56700.1 hypothetical protein CHLNCDRAFT_144070 [Chlorella variabilis]|eukprot:XP_005848802.1 hypothetical protein CHLNCDRAFT_144070 [Chlorella variabilis]